LFFRSRPAAVSGGVTAIDVDAVERQSDRSFAHVGEEIFKDQPTVANGDAATSIISKIIGFGIETAGFHVCPASISARFGSFSIVTVLGFSFFASAANRSSSKVAAVNDDFRPAVAVTKPMRMPVRMRKSHYDETTEAKTRDIDESGHGDLFRRLLRQGADSVDALIRPAFIAQSVLQ
jgi:hypothetical protein